MTDRELLEALLHGMCGIMERIEGRQMALRIDTAEGEVCITNFKDAWKVVPPEAPPVQTGDDVADALHRKIDGLRDMPPHLVDGMVEAVSEAIAARFEVLRSRRQEQRASRTVSPSP